MTVMSRGPSALNRAALRAERVKYEELGFAVINDAIPASTVEELREEVNLFSADSVTRGGVRNLLHRSQRLRQESEQGVASQLAQEILGPEARPTKLTLFDKTPAANWAIRWHQDLTITVRERREVVGFSAWSLKEGILHVRPPISVLRGVVALRLHLDHTPATNGALRVLPGSHRLGRLDRETVLRLRESTSELVCEVASGGIMLMSPLLLHASSKSVSPAKRRVLHFEYSAEPLPGELEWA